MRLEISQANAVRLLDNDDSTLASCGIPSAPTVSTITCALPSFNRTAILAGFSLAVCTYLVFHPTSAPEVPVSSSSSTTATASSSLLSPITAHYQIKTQIIFFVAAHTLVNRRFESIVSFLFRQAQYYTTCQHVYHCRPSILSNTDVASVLLSCYFSHALAAVAFGSCSTTFTRPSSHSLSRSANL
jgi:hypothetical protein